MKPTRVLVCAFSLSLLLVGCAPSLYAPTEPPAPIAPVSRVAPGVLVVKDAGNLPLMNTAIPLTTLPGSLLLAQSYTGKESVSRFHNPSAFEKVLQAVLEEAKTAGWGVLSEDIHLSSSTSAQATAVLIKNQVRLELRLIRSEAGYLLEVRS